VWRVYAHSGFVRGLSVAPDGNSFFSCGDKTVKQWELRVAEDTSEVRFAALMIPLRSINQLVLIT
jgi:WD40 repeat protein